jgi:hypothetical protein
MHVDECKIHDNGNACKKCDVMVMHIRMPYNGDACKNANDDNACKNAM